MGDLVSAVIVSYNSAPFIVETLESVLNQTWIEIELIITDDCSGDNTIEICKSWMNLNRQRFSNVKLLTSEKNTGVPANANRGLNASKGNWIFFLAGDDTLKSNCIEDNMAWIDSNSWIRVLFSKVDVFKDTFEPQNFEETIPIDPYVVNGIMAPDRCAESQFRMLLISDRIHYTPSLFLHRETLLSVGGFDERFKMLEDYPLWLNLTRNGHKLCFMDCITVNYRRHAKAINNTGRSHLINPNYFKQEYFRRVYTYPYLPVDVRLNARFVWFASQIFRINWLNKDKGLNKLLLSLLTHYFNPFQYIIWLRKRLSSEIRKSEFYV